MRNKGMCSFKRDSKVYALNAVEVGGYDYEDIGIAADETERLGQLSKTKRSILAERGIANADAFVLCREKNALSPHYETATRDGCVLCGNAKSKEVASWLLDYPQAREKLLELQAFCMRVRPDRYPLRGKQLYLDNENSFAEQTTLY